MENKLKELGAVMVADTVTYELCEYDANHVKLQHLQQPEQFIIISIEALPGIASILSKAAKRPKTDWL